MIDKIINDWLGDLQTGLVENYNKLGLKASGKWEQSLEQFKRGAPTGYEIGIKGMRYTGAMLYGRKPNADQGPEALRKWAGWAGSTFIAQWVKDKGINANPYAVAYGIARKGTKVPNKHNTGTLISDVLTEERISTLSKAMLGYYIKDFAVRTRKMFTDGN